MDTVITATEASYLNNPIILLDGSEILFKTTINETSVDNLLKLIEELTKRIGNLEDENMTIRMFFTNIK